MKPARSFVYWLKENLAEQGLCGKTFGVIAMRVWMKRGLALLVSAALCMPAGAWAQSAVVDNGSNPDTRLNLRREAGTQSRSLGKF